MDARRFVYGVVCAALLGPGIAGALALAATSGHAAQDEDLLAKGRGYYSAEKYEIALLTLLEAVKRRPESAPAYLLIGNIYVHKKEFPQAAGYYRIGLDLAEDRGPFLYNLGLATYYEGKFRDAIGWFGQAIAARSNFVDAHLEMGRAFFQLSDRTNTITQWETYLVKAPNNPQADNIRKALEILKRTNFMFPADRKKADDDKRLAEEKRRQELRDRLLGLMNKTNTQGTNRSLSDKDVQTKLKDVDTKAKGKADFDQGEGIEKD